MKDQCFTDDQISFLAFPSVIPQTNCVNTIAYKENCKKLTDLHRSLHTVGDGNNYDLPSQWLTEIASLFPFKNFHSQAESSELGFGSHWIHYLSRLLAFWLKATFLSSKISLLHVDFQAVSSQTWLGNTYSCPVVTVWTTEQCKSEPELWPSSPLSMILGELCIHSQLLISVYSSMKWESNSPSIRWFLWELNKLIHTKNSV